MIHIPKKYVDFDGVILDTEGPLFEGWLQKPNYLELPESEKVRYIQEIDWNLVIYNSMIINDSIYIL